MDEAAPAGILAFIMGMFLFFCLGGLVLQAIICWVLSGWLGSIPPEHRKQEPGMVWLLMIPLFNFVWHFFVYPRIADSFDSYFKANNQPNVDPGKSLALTFCILVPCSIIPYLGALCALAALVLWIVIMVKFKGMKDRIASPSAG